MPYYLTPEQDDFNQIPELRVCIAEASAAEGRTAHHAPTLRQSEPKAA
jgi:hypothetical protein